MIRLFLRHHYHLWGRWSVCVGSKHCLTGNKAVVMAILPFRYVCTTTWAICLGIGPCPTTWVVVTTHHTSLSGYKWRELYMHNNTRTVCIFVGMYCAMQSIPTNMLCSMFVLCCVYFDLVLVDLTDFACDYFTGTVIRLLGHRRIWANAPRKVM